tara:strand:+ start:412 stop:849 length:438 start_codon:yes stop_codon:yes gene_type:complete
MKDIRGVFRNLEKQMKQSAWFNSNWEIFNRGDYFQLYKTNWHNNSQGGVHFETYIEAPQIKKKMFPIHMHAEEDCPFQQEFIRNFLNLEGERISSWKGYEILGTGYSICTRNLPLNFKNMELRLMEEFARLRKLESSIDKILQNL